MKLKTLLELRQRHPANKVSDANGHYVVMVDGDYYLFKQYDEVIDKDAARELIKKLGMTGVDDVDNITYGDIASYLIDERHPHVIFGYIDDDMLRITRTSLDAQSPITSPAIKKLVHELRLDGAVGEDEEDEEEIFFPKREMKGDLPDYLYHGTSSEYLDSIMSKGLIGEESRSNWAESGIAHNNLVFGTDHINRETIFHATRTARRTGGIAVILKLKVPDKNNLVPDFDIAAELGLSDDDVWNTGYEDLENFHSRGSETHYPKKLWKRMGIFGYRGRIPPSHIVKIYSDFEEDISLNPSFEGTYKEFREIMNEYYGDWDDED